MLHTNTVILETSVEEDRLDPKYFRFLDARKKLIDASEMTFHELDDKYVTDCVTDGEHQAIPIFHEGDEEAQIRYLYGHNVKEGIIDLTDSAFISLQNHIKRLKRSRLRNGDVLLTIVGTIGKSAMVHDYLGEANIPRNIARITTNRSNLLPEFLTAFFLSQFGREQSYYSSGGNIQGLLSLTKLRAMLVPVPRIKVQENIACLYSEALQKEEEALTLINEARSYFCEELGIDFSRFKKERFYNVDFSDISNADLWCPAFVYPLYVKINNEIKNRWHVEKIGKIVDDISGDEVGSVNYSDFIFRKKDSVPFIRTSDIVNYDVDLDPDYFIPREIFDTLKQDIRAGDLLFTKDGNVGLSAMTTKSDKVILSSGILHIRKKTEEAELKHLSNEYLFMVLSTKETGIFPALQRTVVASTIPHLRKERFRDIDIPILGKEAVSKITDLVKRAFLIKDEKKVLLQKVKLEIDEMLGYS